MNLENLETFEDFKVGECLPYMAEGIDGVRFQVSGSGCTAIFSYNHPLQREINQFKTDKPFEIRMTPLDGVIMMTFKIGNLDWMDAPFSSHLALTMDIPDDIPDGSGFPLAVIVIDSSSGKVEYIRMIELSTKFSREFVKAVRNDINRDFDWLKYHQKLGDIYARYSSVQLSKMSPSASRYKLKIS